jgi:PQQ-dependent dehydrogenase (methanol/ethanol family)
MPPLGNARSATASARRRWVVTTVAGVTLLTGIALISSGDRASAADAGVAAGKQVFNNVCSSCHSAQAGGAGFGPSLAGVVGRKAGTLAGYKYSSAMANSGLAWDASTLDAFLTDTTKKVPGTSMSLAIAEKTQRAAVIAYLATLGRPAAAAASTPAAVAAAPSAPIAPLTTGPTQDELLHAASNSQDWLYVSKDWAGQRFVDLNQITASNAANIRPVCIYRSNNAGATQTGPLVYKGVLYMTIDQSIVAIDAATCRERWTYNWSVTGPILSATNRGVAIKDGRVIRGTADGFLIAVDMSSGRLLWSRKIADAKASQYLSMPPLIYDGLVIYGPAGGDWGSKNWIGAFRLDSGEPVWRFDLIAQTNAQADTSWKDPQSMTHGGGAIWTPVSLDAQKGVLYVPVGNPAPDFYGDARPGSNLYTDSALALDIKTGKLLWYDQFRAHDTHDSDLSQVSPLFHAAVKGKQRDLLTVSGKDGLLRMVDRDSHEVLYEIPITTRENTDADPTEAGVHACPGLLGGMEWNGPAYDPRTTTLYVATVDWCGTLKKFEPRPQYAQNQHYYGGVFTPDARDKAKGWLTAIDAGTGAVRWRDPWPTPLVAGLTATAGGVLFTGDLNNDFVAIDAHDGKTLYQFNTGGSIGGGVISYEVSGKQYVATTSGVVSGFFGGTGTSALIVFALP